MLDRREDDRTPTLDVRPSACFKPLRTITNATGADNPQDAKRSRRLQPGEAQATGLAELVPLSRPR